MNVSKYLLLVLLISTTGVSMTLLSRPHVTELFSITPQDEYVVQPGKTIAQRIRLLPEAHEMWVRTNSSANVFVTTATDKENAPGDILTTEELTPTLLPSGFQGVHISIPPLNTKFIWVTLTSADDEQLRIFREIDSTKYRSGKLLLQGSRQIPGVIGFSLVNQSRSPYLPFHTASIFSLLLVTWIIIALRIKTTVP